MKVASYLVDQLTLKDFCERNHIRKLAVFGSVLRTDFTPQSDIDVLVEFYPGHIPGFFKLWEIEQELSEIFGGRKIDLVTTGFIALSSKTMFCKNRGHSMQKDDDVYVAHMILTAEKAVKAVEGKAKAEVLVCQYRVADHHRGSAWLDTCFKSNWLER